MDMVKRKITRGMLLIYSLSLFFHSPLVKAQSSEYTIESFQGDYTELSSYHSIYLLTGGDPLWEYDFNLEFPFPFYDSTYTWMHYDEESWGSFTQDQDVSLLLMNYRSYTYDTAIDTSNIVSDVRFSHTEANNMQAFVIQFTKVRFFADPFADSLDTYLNFQIWFYENGVIEVHFGDMHMDNTPIYAPGKGFYDFTTSGGVDTTYVAGPHMGISHPLEEENAIALNGTHDNYEVVGDQYSVLATLPPVGWVIQFKPKSLTTSDPNTYEKLEINPNPTSGIIYLPYIEGKAIIFDGIGRIVFRGYLDGSILDVTNFSAGIYVIQIVSKDKIYTGRFSR